MSAHQFVQSFGPCLDSVCERDIDLLLMEEFSTNPSFLRWFVAQLGLEGDCRCLGSWRGVTTYDGETDVLLILNVQGHRLGVLIENKISAPEQLWQASRYHLRALEHRDGGHFQDYRTVVIAPRRYLAVCLAGAEYMAAMSYESIRDWYARCSGRRNAWRGAVFEEAIRRSKRSCMTRVHAARTNFHRKYWAHVRDHYPGLVMREPLARSWRSYRFFLRAPDLRQGVRLVHKADCSRVDLEMARTLAQLVEIVLQDRSDDIMLSQRGLSSVLSLPVLDLYCDEAFEEQIEIVDYALRSAIMLADYMKGKLVEDAHPLDHYIGSYDGSFDHLMFNIRAEALFGPIR